MLTKFGKLVKATSAFKIVTVVNSARDDDHVSSEDEDARGIKAVLLADGIYPGAPAPEEVMEGPVVTDRDEALSVLLQMTDLCLSDYGEGESGQVLVIAMDEGSRVQKFLTGYGSEVKNAWVRQDMLGQEEQDNAAERQG